MKQFIKTIIYGSALSLVSAISVIPALVNAAGGASEQPLYTQSLRGETPIDSVNKAPELKKVHKEQVRIKPQTVSQPPLIPHSIRGYKIDRDSNRCLSCHSWENYQTFGAPKVSITHFVDREGKQLSDVSTDRYFCNQCHVTQADAKPLRSNNFKPVKSLQAEK